MKKLKKYRIISEGIEDCDRLMKKIARDEKTNYITGDCFKINEYQVAHFVTSEHNRLNIQRKYNNFKIETV